ncbi:Glutamate decarboxylase 2 [Exophiala oligosperma]
MPGFQGLRQDSNPHQLNGYKSQASSNGITDGFQNGTTTPSRASQLKTLLEATLDQLIPFVQRADDEVEAHQLQRAIGSTSLVESHPPDELRSILSRDGTLSLPDDGTGRTGLLDSLASILKYSVNTSSPGFLDKLYAAPLPPGIAADLILSVLNTNLHVYQVSPVLSLIETHVAKELASMFGFTGPRAGGINVQGGSASNLTSIVIARNSLFPQTKTLGNSADGLRLVMFTSEHGHYSIEKAAQQCGFGSESVVPVPVDPVTGTMDADALESLIVREKRVNGTTPFYVNATAGSTVLGSFDPFVAVSRVARKYGLWMHIDGAWGGSFVFSETLRGRSLRGCELADSIAVNPHKMLGVPVTCSFLLLKDLRDAHRSNTLRAGYLFHDTAEDEDNTTTTEENGEDDWPPPEDLADLTLQCGRRGDSLKLFLSWQYYGTSGYRNKIETAHSVACHMAQLVEDHPDLVLVSTNPPPCLQVCFYYAPGGKMTFDLTNHQVGSSNGDRSATTVVEEVGKRNTAITSRMTQKLISRGFMVDFAPALSNAVERGSFFRGVVNISTTKETVERLIDDLVEVGKVVVEERRRK